MDFCSIFKVENQNVQLVWDEVYGKVESLFKAKNSSVQKQQFHGLLKAKNLVTINSGL